MPKFKQVQEWIKKLISKKGMIEFTTGDYTIFVNVKIKKGEKIFFRVESYDETTCGYLPDNKFDITQKEKGFIVDAKVESELVKFYWSVKC